MNFQNISLAEKFYTACGYQLIEVPWLVSPEAIRATLPTIPKRRFQTFAGELVGSGEQSFVQLMLDGKLGPGMYQCTTPCFRDDAVDELHRQYFMKNELIWVGEKNRFDHAFEIVGVAKRCFKQFLDPKVVLTGAGFDLVYNGIELGSYGTRHYNGFYWAYGTGYAEPRMSQAIKVFYEYESGSRTESVENQDQEQ